MNLTIFQYAKSNPRVGLKLDNAALAMVTQRRQTYASRVDLDLFIVLLLLAIKCQLQY